MDTSHLNLIVEYHLLWGGLVLLVNPYSFLFLGPALWTRLKLYDHSYVNSIGQIWNTLLSSILFPRSLICIPSSAVYLVMSATNFKKLFFTSCDGNYVSFWIFTVRGLKNKKNLKQLSKNIKKEREKFFEREYLKRKQRSKNKRKKELVYCSLKKKMHYLSKLFYCIGKRGKFEDILREPKILSLAKYCWFESLHLSKIWRG